jgi:hypothetical protein
MEKLSPGSTMTGAKTTEMGEATVKLRFVARYGLLAWRSSDLVISPPEIVKPTGALSS